MYPPPESTGQTGGVNISGTIGSVGGDITGRDKIIIGIPPDQLPAIIEAATSDWKRLTDEQRNIITELESKLGVSAGALRAFFQTLGEADVPPERQEAKLVEIAERYKQLVAHIGKRKEEIYDLISTDQVSQAVKRIMDFVSDFSGDKGNLREVIVISQNYHRLEKSERRGTFRFEDLEQRRNQLLYQALELIDQIAA